MKITCQSCQSKYNVADEKVQGKIVKIRCRKCGATIVVNGANVTAANGTADAGEAPPPASSRPAENVSDPWHVNLAENDQRTMGLAELVDAYNAGVVTQDTFVWTEGMGDWKPLGEVEAVISALHEHASHSSSQSEGSPKATTAPVREAALEAPAHTFTAAASAPYEAPVFAAASTAADPGARQEPKRAAVKREGRARDLFATGLGDSHGTQDMQGNVETSAPLMHAGMAPIDDPNKLTGERNENSVLFSLAVLTKTVEDRAPAVSDAPSSSREDSGLIDLKALAAKTESMRPLAMADGSVFSSPIGGMAPLSSPLGAIDAPLGEANAKSSLPRIIGLVAAVALLLVLGIVIGVKVAGGSNPAATAGSAAASAASSAGPEATASAAASAPVDSAAAAAASASVAAATAKPKPAAGGPVWHPQAPVAKPATAGGGAATAGGGGVATPPAAAATAKKNDCGCNGDLMCLMKCSTH